MKKLLRQQKLILWDKKKDTVISSWFQIAFSILSLALFVLMETIHPLASFPTQAIAQTTTPPSSLPLLTQNLLLETTESSPSVQIETPIISELQRTLEEPKATEAAGIPLATQNEDFCITMPVIMYHHIQPLALAEKLGHTSLTVDSNMFDSQMQYLKDHHYTAISLDELIDALYAHRSLPEKPVMITLDDGYDDNYTYAFMTAKKHRMVMNFMIPTGLVDKAGYVTWDHLREMRDNPYAKIYNHTTTHAGLGVIAKEQVIHEVTTANKDLEEKLGLQNKYVIYPYGSYNDMAIETLKELGMTAAVSTDPGRNECLSNIMKLPRVRAGNASLDTYGL